MEILFSNLLIYLTRYAYILRSFIKNKYGRLTIEICKWLIYAYAFYLLKCYSAFICYMLLVPYAALKTFNLSKYYVFNILIFLISIVFLFLLRDYSLINIIPYVVLFLNVIIKPSIKNKTLSSVIFYTINILICVYSYINRLFVLFIFKVLDMAFPIASKSVKGITDFANKRTN